MRFNRHSNLEGKHSFLSPSKYAWVRYDDDKLGRVFMSHLAALRGTREHKFACDAVTLGHKLPDDVPKTMNLYVNDCIGYRLTTEVPLFWSDFCFGTADALGYSKHENRLRIFDLKTGHTVTKVDQLEIYAALFCLEYEFRPFDIEIELRIYQGNEARIYEADPDAIFHIMDRIITGTKLLEQIRSEQQS